MPKRSGAGAIQRRMEQARKEMRAWTPAQQARHAALKKGFEEIGASSSEAWYRAYKKIQREKD